MVNILIEVSCTQKESNFELRVYIRALILYFQIYNQGFRTIAFPVLLNIFQNYN